MAIPCTEPVSQKFQSRRSVAKVSFSSKQAEMFRRMAWETRQVVRSAGTRKLGASSSSGIVAWFAGPSGTGKTMAAEAIARELRTGLYRVKLSQVVSKYIGETEKHLSWIFDLAQRKGAILFFDEADALLGKRSQIKDAHDRYANIETNYLLAKVEAYRGLVILTSNRKVDLDPKAMCRVKYLLEFSPPIPSPLSQSRR